jgi:hypothetical protein
MQVRQLASPRVIKTHLSVDMLPRQVACIRPFYISDDILYDPLGNGERGEADLCHEEPSGRSGEIYQA